VTTAARVSVLPDVPIVGDTVPGYEASGWFGVGAPKGTPREIVDKLNREINAGLADRSIEKLYGDLGSTPMPFAPGEYVSAEIEKWAKVVKASGVKPV
jgi:tripartite-type tricarboxylate transporter receptor subunit TctC